MHEIEPYYNWRALYVSSEDPASPFFGKEYSEFYCSEYIYDHYIHPQWDNMGSPTLYIKILFADYDQGYAIIELIGEWNDLLHNDIMHFKRNILETLMNNGVTKFILIAENVLNFHYSDDCYYEEWFEELLEVDGWIAAMNIRQHVFEDFQEGNIDSYLLAGGQLNELKWRTKTPDQLFANVESQVLRRIGV